MGLIVPTEQSPRVGACDTASICKYPSFLADGICGHGAPEPVAVCRSVHMSSIASAASSFDAVSSARNYRNELKYLPPNPESP